MSAKWHPAMTCGRFGRPEPGWILALKHAVWRVTSVTDVDRAGNGPSEKPYRVAAEFIGGVEPDSMNDGNRSKAWTIGVDPSRRLPSWDRYVDGRWPQCSCCGEPMPCRAELTDRLVDAGMKQVDAMESRLPGSCWGCGDPITTRSQAVRYTGENIDLPGGIPVVFHLRKDCRWYAAKYEERWLAADRDRRRILTYPRCGGSLLTHKDGSQECAGEGRDPDCRGAISHDHGSHAACYAWGPECGKGCPKPASREGAWGCAYPKRPKLRDPDLPQGRLPVPPEPPDSRPECHGTLFVHEDGTGDCKGGRDDCWDGVKYRHRRKRDCLTLTHGCPKCETTAA